jgi:hypothetical protein
MLMNLIILYPGTRTENPRVGSSILSLGTIQKKEKILNHPIESGYSLKML